MNRKNLMHLLAVMLVATLGVGLVSIIRKTIFSASPKRNDQSSEPKSKTKRSWKRQTHKQNPALKSLDKSAFSEAFLCAKICSIQGIFVPLHQLS